MSKNVGFISRLDHLRKRLASSKVATKQECAETLTEIMRGRMTDFGEMSAAGFVPDISKESRNSAALCELTSRNETSGEGDGKKDAVINRVKLESKIAAEKALAELMGYNAPAESNVHVSAPTTYLFNHPKPDKRPRNRK